MAPRALPPNAIYALRDAQSALDKHFPSISLSAGFEPERNKFVMIIRSLNPFSKEATPVIMESEDALELESHLLAFTAAMP